MGGSPDNGEFRPRLHAMLVTSEVRGREEEANAGVKRLIKIGRVGRSKVTCQGYKSGLGCQGRKNTLAYCGGGGGGGGGGGRVDARFHRGKGPHRLQRPVGM